MIETLATPFEGETDDKTKYTLLFMHYYKECINPAMEFNLDIALADPEKKQVVGLTKCNIQN